MKKHVFKILVILASVYCSTVYGQNAKVSFSVTGEPISGVLEEIEKQTDYAFIYDSQIVDVSQSVTLKVDSESISNVLNKLFTNTEITYLFKDNNFVLNRKAPQNSGIPVKGKVTDKEGEPVTGASVMLVGTNIGTITDLDGNFSLEAEIGSKLTVSFVGYTQLQSV